MNETEKNEEKKLFFTIGMYKKWELKIVKMIDCLSIVA